MPNVLVVDDAADIRMLVRAILGREGFDVSEAPSGPDALMFLDKGPAPDVILLDVQMPDMDGWDTLAAVRRRPRGHEVAVILCTVKGHADDARRAWSLGCDGYLTKPFSITDLVRAVSAIAARSTDERVADRAVRLGASQNGQVVPNATLHMGRNQ